MLGEKDKMIEETRKRLRYYENENSPAVLGLAGIEEADGAEEEGCIWTGWRHGNRPHACDGEAAGFGRRAGTP